jgi:Spy/CpxP family protein refolding chaperone
MVLGLAAAGVLGTVSATAALAQPGPGPGMGNGERHVMRIHRRGPGGGAFMGSGSAERMLALAEELDLTDAQKTKLREIRRRAPGILSPKRLAVVEARMDLHDLLEQKDADAKALRLAHDKVTKARGELEAATFDLRLQARDVLTVEQREKLQADLRKEVGPRALRMHRQMGGLPGLLELGTLGGGDLEAEFLDLADDPLDLGDIEVESELDEF